MGCLLVAEVEEAEMPKVFIANPTVRPRWVTDVTIICGNCAGDEAQTVETRLTAEGRCSHCGGRSYILASKIQRGDYEPDRATANHS